MKAWVNDSCMARDNATFGDVQIHYLPSLKELEVTIHSGETWTDNLSFFRNQSTGKWQIVTTQDGYDMDDDPEMVAALEAIVVARSALYGLLAQRLGEKDE